MIEFSSDKKTTLENYISISKLWLSHSDAGRTLEPNLKYVRDFADDFTDFLYNDCSLEVPPNSSLHCECEYLIGRINEGINKQQLEDGVITMTAVLTKHSREILRPELQAKSLQAIYKDLAFAAEAFSSWLKSIDGLEHLLKHQSIIQSYSAASSVLICRLWGQDHET